MNKGAVTVVVHGRLAGQVVEDNRGAISSFRASFREEPLPNPPRRKYERVKAFEERSKMMATLRTLVLCAELEVPAGSQIVLRMPQCFDHRPEPGAFGVCRRCGSEIKRKRKGVK